MPTVCLFVCLHCCFSFCLYLVVCLMCCLQCMQLSHSDIITIVVSGMQLLRLRSAIRRHHPPQRAVLSQNICCFGECKVVLFQILLDGAEPHVGVFSSLPEGRLTGSSWHNIPKSLCCNTID